MCFYLCQVLASMDINYIGGNRGRWQQQSYHCFDQAGVKRVYGLRLNGIVDGFTFHILRNQIMDMYLSVGLCIYIYMCAWWIKEERSSVLWVQAAAYERFGYIWLDLRDGSTWVICNFMEHQPRDQLGEMVSDVSSWNGINVSQWNSTSHAGYATCFPQWFTLKLPLNEEVPTSI